MSLTFRVLEGADRGKVFDCAAPPITLGREDGNVIQLNDERISRFHAKIQEDQDKLILTDLDSTNGTKVNGEDVSIRILRVGDVITVGRSSLLFGSREEIAARLKELRKTAAGNGSGLDALSERIADLEPENNLDQELRWSEDSNLRKTIHVLQPPELPVGLTPGQTAQVHELLEYLHVTIRDLTRTVTMQGEPERITINFRQWQFLLDVQARLAGYLRQIGDPDTF